MKASRMSVYFFILKYLAEKSFALLNEKEENLTKALMNEFKIRHWILVQNSNIISSDVAQLKNYTKWKMPLTIFSMTQLTKYFLKELFPDVNTLIVIKEVDIKIISGFIRILSLKYPFYCFLNWKWVIFVNQTLTIEQEHDLEISYHSLFLIVQNKNKNIYLLKEIYKIKEKTFSLNYGTWALNSGLEVSKNSFYVRRFDLNDSELVIDTGENEYLKCPRHPSLRRCAHFKILKDFSKLFNFRLKWMKYPPNSMTSTVTGDIFSMATGFNPDNQNFLDYDYVGPFFKVVVNWYIQRPNLQEQSDYFIRPFHYNLWNSIFVWLLIGIIFTVILYYGSKRLADQYNFLDLLFLTFDTFCNQDGFPKKIGSPLRIACFTFRFLALFIISSYSGVLISFLAVRQPHIPFETLEELLNDGRYVMGAWNKSYTSTLIQVSKSQVLQRIYQNYFIPVDDSEIPEKFCNELFAMIDPDNDIYARGIYCPIYRLKEPVTFILTATTMKRHSIYTRIFNHAFLKYYSSGIQKKMHREIVGTGRAVEEDQTLSDVTFNQITQVLSIVLFGTGLSFIIFLIENLIYTLKKKAKANNTIF